ncbi:peptidoglycan-binding domain-containing protein [Streptomyces sp. JB150]|uniref:peptidoglycan-binding domain-containing protein n=1 Tax=Streptomyces sp. JB150 TaxID=2714844 RepID=UPI001F1117C2|nr:peptidoglycan-binding domain-containing protein [Streptomyces sp. JB150]
MAEPRGHACPDCGAARGTDNTPSCGCGPRASEALRDARTAEQAAAEDFDPLRIRPYVELDGAGAPVVTPSSGDAEPTMPLRPVEPGPPAPAPPTAAVPTTEPPTTALPATEPATTVPPAEEPPTAALPVAEPPTTVLPTTEPATTVPPAEEPPTAALPTAALPTAQQPTTVLPTPLAPPSAAPSADDLDLFAEPSQDEPARREPARREPAPGEPSTGAGRPGTSRRTVALLVSGAVVAVATVVAVTSGLFSYDTPSRNTALPTDVREAVPEARTTEPPRTPVPSTASAPPASASPSPSASASASPSPSPSRSSASPTPTPTPTPTESTTAARVTSSPEAPGETTPVLRRGDRGPEVTELQQRLHQLYLYNDAPHGHFDEAVEQSLRNYQWSRGLQDELSVYGPKTRGLLESETREP